MEAHVYPIIYVRGYAMTENERDETAADPFCGFNLGSTVYRSAVNPKDPAKKFIFESPLVRLASDYGYTDVYEEGRDITDPEWTAGGEGAVGIPASSVVVYRYYDAGSGLLGDGKASPIETYARGLSDLILKVRDMVVAHERIASADFKCYLVAHSMGGLVARAFLQNAKLGDKIARSAVDKFFTYATPHNGIEVLGGNVPPWLSLNELNTFNRDRMAGYLGLETALQTYGRVDYMPEQAFPLQRVFCMVGTNRNDYEAAAGLSRTFAGNGSDGLVKVANAGLWGLDKNNRVTGSAATAYCYRAHSGFFGIVNSEEAYQNLVRFLFGDVRVDIWLDVDEVTLPNGLPAGNVEASYQFELLASARGKRWSLSRRKAEEDSPACRSHKQLTANDGSGSNLVYLSTVFLSNRARVNKASPTLSYAMDIGVRVPDYEVDRSFWPNQHYEGGHILQDRLTLVLTPPDEGAADPLWKLAGGWMSKGVVSAGQAQPLGSISAAALKGEPWQVLVPFVSPTKAPGIQGKVRLVVSPWNQD